MITSEKKYLKDPGIVHTIRENIIFTEFQKFLENLLSQSELFTQNCSIDKIVKALFSRSRRRQRLWRAKEDARDAKKILFNINKLSLRSLPFDFAQGHELVEWRLGERLGLPTKSPSSLFIGCREAV